MPEITETLSEAGVCYRDCAWLPAGKPGQEMVCDHGRVWVLSTGLYEPTWKWKKTKRKSWIKRFIST